MRNNIYFFTDKEKTYAFDSRKIIFSCLDVDAKKVLKDISDRNMSDIPKGSFADLMLDAGYFWAEEKEPRYQYQKFDTMNISFAPIHACNFRCRYCYADGGEATDAYNQRFTRNKVDKLLDYVYYKRFSSYRKYKFDFVSGGEPLLAFDVLEYFLKRVREIDKKFNKETTVFLATNGTCLSNEIIDKLAKYDVFLGISLDGPADIHNQHRKYKDGSDTYEDVIAAVERLFNAKVPGKLKEAWALCVVSNKTDDLIAVMENAVNLGFKRLQMQILRVPQDHYLGFSEKNVKTLFGRYKSLFYHILEYAKKGDLSRLKMIANNNDSFGKYLSRLILRQPVYSRCFAGKNKIAITAEGKVFPCDSFCNLEQFILDDLTLSVNNKKNWDYFKELQIFDSKECSQCWCRYICGGDCYYHSFDINKNVSVPDPIFCQISKFFIEQAIVMLLELHQYRPESIVYLRKMLGKG